MKSIAAHELTARNPGQLPGREGQGPLPAWLRLIREAVDAVDYGTIQIKVHASEVVQIETTRKIRVSSKGAQPASSEEPTN